MTDETRKDRTVVVVLTMRVEVTGPHGSDGFVLAPMLACDAIGIPQGGWQPARKPTLHEVEGYGHRWEVKAFGASAVATYEKHEGWLR